MTARATVLETPIMVDTLVDITALPTVMAWRNNVGVARTRRGAVLRFGLPGSADILGVRAVTITPDMVGRTIGQAVAIESKSETGTQKKNQGNFQRRWEQKGGLYVLARSPDVAVAALTSDALA